jgi:predicted permease
MAVFFETLFQDIRYAARALKHNPGFTSIAILTLALGIGVNCAIFSLVYAVLLRPLPYAQPDRLALIWSTFEKSGVTRAPTSPPLLAEIQHRTRLLENVAGVWATTGTFTGGPGPEQVKIARVTPNLPALLGIRPALGRLFAPDEWAGDKPVLLLSNGLWRSRFGGDPNIVGRAVAFDGESVTVIGVLPENFQLHFPPDSNVPDDVQALTPFSHWIFNSPRTLYFIRLVARLKPGVSFDAARQDLNSVAASIRETYGDIAEEKMQLDLMPMQRDSVRDLRAGLIALFSGAVLVLLICCVNVANLLLARASGRRKEVAMRTALGASLSRIVRQLLTEGFLLSAISAAAGLLLGFVFVRALAYLRPGDISRAGGVSLNVPVLAFVAASAIAATLFFGLVPAIGSLKFDLTRTLRGAGGDTQPRTRRTLRSALVVAEVALGFVLVIGAGLMLRTLANIAHVDPGFDPRNVLTFEISLPGSRYDSTPAMIDFSRKWETRLAAIPGVASAGSSYDVPLDDYPNWYGPYKPDNVSGSQAAGLAADNRCVTPGYFRAMGAHLLAGRVFDGHDQAATRPVAIVDDMLASQTWPGQSAIGKRIQSERLTERGFEPVWAEVVGVIGHLHNQSLARKTRPQIYMPFEQSPRNHLSYAVRTKVDPLSLVPTLRRELRAVDKDLAMAKIRPMLDNMSHAKAPTTFVAVMAAVFAALALFLAALGIYGVIHYSFLQRRREMGVRIALGASKRDLLQLVFSEGLTLSIFGLILGLTAALLTSQYLQSLVYGVSPRDPATYMLAAATLAGAAIFGCWRPAVQAAKTSPSEAIRAE